MSGINEFLSEPNLRLLQLIPYLVYFMLLFHLPYMGMVLGSSGLSLVYGKHKPELSKDFIRLVMDKSRVWIMITFGLLPPVSLAFLYKMLLYNTPIAIHVYLLRILGILVIGFVLLSIYSFLREPLEKKNPKLGNLVILAGAGGILLVLFYCFHFVNLLALLIFPEKWSFIRLPIPYPLFSITPLIHFAGFILLSLIITGAAILFFYYRWPEKRLPEDTPHNTFLKYHGYGLLLAGALLLPLIIFWDLATLPGYSLSATVFILAGLTVPVLSFLGWAAVSMIRHTIKNRQARPRYSVPVFLLVLLLFGLVIGKNHALRANASRETIVVLVSDAQKARNEIISKREEIYAKNMVIDEKLGEQIYNERCTACHLFDKKIIGPPFNSVLPKYIDKQDELAAFIKNPVKVDPEYTAMPNPGLTTIQIRSVVKFLMIKMGENTE
jgi:cytochrome c551/c552